MSQGNRSSRLRAVLFLLALAAGAVFGFWMTAVKATEYYYPGRLLLVIQHQVWDFKVEQPGRHELSIRKDFGDPTFEVVSVDSGTPIPVDRFSVLAQAVHTPGWHGHAFQIDSPGVYRLSAQPWPRRAEVHLSYTNTEAIARWALGGILLMGVCLAWILLLVIRMLKRPREAGGRPMEISKASPA